MTKKPKIAFIVFPHKSSEYECGQLHVTQNLEILSPLCEKITVITGNYFPKKIPLNISIDVVKTPVINSLNESLLSILYRVVLSQFIISLKLIKLRNEVDAIMMFFSNGFLVLPPFLGWVLRKKIIVITTGSFSKCTKSEYKPPLGTILYLMVEFIERFNFSLASIITVASDKIIDDLQIIKYKHKILSNKQTFYLNKDIFKIQRNFSERENIIGFAGRLVAEKGIIELSNAISIIVSKRNNIKFLIVGDGPLMNNMKKIIERNGCLDKVIFTGWLPNDMIPDYLNKMKFHILPSYSEGLGGSNIEASACGAISIVNNVGGLPDIVIDGKTGFVLENNSPQTIERKIEKILEFSLTDLELIQKNARQFVEETYSYENVVDSWREVFYRIYK